MDDIQTTMASIDLDTPQWKEMKPELDEFFDILSTMEFEDFIEDEELIFYNFENDIDEPLGTDVTEPTPTSDPIDFPLLTSPDELHHYWKEMKHFTDQLDQLDGAVKST
jgi:hypothetical protein